MRANEGDNKNFVNMEMLALVIFQFISLKANSLTSKKLRLQQDIKILIKTQHIKFVKRNPRQIFSAERWEITLSFLTFGM